MKASDVMHRKVVTVFQEATLEEAAELMIENRVSGLPVVDGRGKVVGMITERDLMRRMETGTARRASWLSAFLWPGRVADDYVHAHARKVNELLNGTVIAVAPDTSLAEVVAVMESRQVRRVPVMDGEHLVGIIARADLVRALLRQLPPVQAPAITDAQIRAQFLEEVDQQQWASEVVVDSEVKDGVIGLRGIIFDERMRAALGVLAENLKGVRGVQDHLICIDPMTGAVVSEGAAGDAAAAQGGHPAGS
jgi:CBS domain-containing protein